MTKEFNLSSFALVNKKTDEKLNVGDRVYKENRVREFIKNRKARIRNQLRIHWNWLRHKSYEGVADYIDAIDNKLAGESLAYSNKEFLKDIKGVFSEEPAGNHSSDDLSRKSVNPDKRKIAQDKPEEISSKPTDVIQSSGTLKCKNCGEYVEDADDHWKKDIGWTCKKFQEDLRR